LIELKVIQGHYLEYQEKAHIHISISDHK